MAARQSETDLRKITILLPRELVENATRATGKGITPTIRLGLERIAAGHAFEELRKLRGQVRFSVDVDTLREDRE